MEISLKESQWRSRSLLNRNAEGYYKFSHKSVLEYFLAKEAIENPSFTGRLKFEGLDVARRFCEEMVFGKMLKNSEGTFALLNIGKEQPFKQLNKRGNDQPRKSHFLRRPYGNGNGTAVAHQASRRDGLK